MYETLNKEVVEEHLNALCNSKTTESSKHSKAYVGCRINGLVDVMTIQCSDPNCRPCSSFKEAFKKQLLDGQD